MNILFLDVETTGTDENKHSILEIAAEFHKDGEKISQFSTKFADTNSVLSLEALKVNKTSLSEIKERKSEKEGVHSFCDWLINLDTSGGKTYICAHNAHFDKKFIDALFRKYNIENFEKVVSYRIIDTNDRARMLVNAGAIDLESIGAKGTSLTNIAKALGIVIDETKLHTAEYDTEICSKVYYKQMELLEGLVNGKS